MWGRSDNSSSSCPARAAQGRYRAGNRSVVSAAAANPPRAPARIPARAGRSPATAANSRRSGISRSRFVSEWWPNLLFRIASTVGQLSLATRHGISRPSLRGLPIRESITSSGAEQSSESAATSSSYLCVFANSTSAASCSAPRLCFSSTISWARVRSRGAVTCPADLLRDQAQHAADLALGFGRRERQQARLHGLGGLQQELLEQMARHVEAQPDRLGELVVGLRLHHQGREAGFGKVRARHSARAYG